MLERSHGDDQRIVMIRDELERLDLIVDELLAYSRGMTIERADCALDEQAGGCQDARAPGAARRCRTLGHRCGDDRRRSAARVSCCSTWCSMIQAQHDGGGAVRIAVDETGFRIEDDGPGVPADLEDRLFDPFTSERPGGTGLGLNIARSDCRSARRRHWYARARRGGAASRSGPGLDGLEGIMAQPNDDYDVRARGRAAAGRTSPDR